MLDVFFGGCEMRYIARLIGGGVAGVGWLVVCLAGFTAVSGLRSSDSFAWVIFCVVAFLALVVAFFGHRLRAWGFRQKGQSTQPSFLGMLETIDRVCDSFGTLLLVGVGAVMVGGGASLVAGVFWLARTSSPTPPPAASQVAAIVSRPDPVVAAPAMVRVQPVPFVAVITEEPVSALSLSNAERRIVEPAAPPMLTSREPAQPKPVPTKTAIASPPPKPGPDHVWVKPFKKKDGTMVAGYWRHSPPPATPSVSSSSTSSPGKIWVKGYTRKDGKQVDGYWRDK